MKRAVVLTISIMLISLNAYAQGEDGFAPGEDALGQGDTETPPGTDPGYSPAATGTPAPAAMAPLASAPRSDTSVGAFLGPKFGVVNSAGTLFTLGGEIATKHFQLPLLLGFGGGMDLMLELVPKFKYDIEVIPNLVITPSGGLDIWFGFGGGTGMSMGIEIAARATYFVTPQIGVFFEPLAMDMNFFAANFDSGNTAGDFWMLYRMLAGAVYAF